MNTARQVEVVLVGRQPFRCRWSNMAVPLGHERHLVLDRLMLDQVDMHEMGECFTCVHVIDRLDAASAGRVIEGLLAGGSELTAVATNDEYLLGSCAQLQERFGLTGPSQPAITTFTDKLAMKQAVLEAGLLAPAGMALDPDEAKADPVELARRVLATCGLPVVLKPRSSANSLDVSVVHTAAELASRCRHLNRSDFMAEAFIPGRVLFCDTLQDGISGDRISLMTAQYVSPPLEYRTGARHGSRTLSDGSLCDELHAFTTQVLDALPTMQDRITHLEVLEYEGRLWFLEVAARAPGAEVAGCGELHRGMNFEELNFRLQLGLPWTVDSPPHGHVAWVWFPKRDGTVLARTPPPLVGPATLTWQVETGEVVAGATHSPNNRRDDAALIVVIGPSELETLETDFATLATFEPVTYSGLLDP